MTLGPNYDYRIRWSAADEAYVGTVEELPWLSWVDDSPETALAGVRELVANFTGDVAGSGAASSAATADRSPRGETSIRHPSELTGQQADAAERPAKSTSEHSVGAPGDRGDDQPADSENPELSRGGGGADLGNVLRQALADHAEGVLRAQAAVSAAASALSSARSQIQRQTPGLDV